MANDIARRIGTFVAVVGPSGAGKDSLIRYARERLNADPGYVFVRRIVTREADASLEDHDSWTSARFARAEADGRFALSWQAHGLGYGLPDSIHDDIAAGRVVIANISRRSIDDARSRFPRCRIVSVTAPRAILAERLAARGRESRQDIEQRLDRALPALTGADVATIENGGRLAEAGETLLRLLSEFRVSSA